MSAPTLEVVKTIYASNGRDIAATLRAIADQIEAGQFGDINQAALVLHGPTVEVFRLGVGTASDTHLLLACGQRQLENGVLFT